MSWPTSSVIVDHDAVTVLDQGLGGAKDFQLASICKGERRAIVTLDKDFSDIRSYPPSEYAGLVVFRLQTQGRMPEQPA